MFTLISTKQIIASQLHNEWKYIAITNRLNEATIAFIKHGKTDPIYQLRMNNIQSLLQRM